MKVVYRVESVEGEGPYRGNNEVCKLLCKKHNNRDIELYRCPLPQDDGINIYPYTELSFGFLTKKDLYKWFTKKERYLLSYANYFIYVYEVCTKDLLIGGHQVLFNKKSSIRINKLNLI